MRRWSPTLARCQIDPSMPRPSIETLLHAFVSSPHVDHTHPDTIGAIVGNRRRRASRPGVLRRRCRVDPVHPPQASRSPSSSSRRSLPHPEAKMVLLAKHGLVTWGDTAAILRVDPRCDQTGRLRFIAERTRDKLPFGGRIVEPAGDAERADLLAEALPALRGAVSVDGPRIPAGRHLGRVSSSPAVGFAAALAGGARRAPITSSTRGVFRSGWTSTRAPRMRLC